MDAMARAVDACILDLSASREPEPAGDPVHDRQPSMIPEDWLALPRTDFSLGQWLAPLGPRFNADVLFRHRKLNPEDAVIPRESRQSLQSLLDSLGPELQALDSLTGILSDREANEFFDRLPHKELIPAARRWTDSAGTGHDVDVFSLSQAEDLVVVSRSGRSFGISVRDLPGLRGLNERRAWLILEIGNLVTMWFRVHVATPTSAMDAVMADVSAWSERRRQLSLPRQG